MVIACRYVRSQNETERRTANGLFRIGVKDNRPPVSAVKVYVGPALAVYRPRSRFLRHTTDITVVTGYRDNEANQGETKTQYV